MKIEGTDIEKKIMPLYLQGKKIQEIADEFCIRSKYKLLIAINQYIDTTGDRKNIDKQRAKNISKEDIFLLYNQGYRYTQIGKMYDISTTIVKNKIKEYCNAYNITLDDINYKNNDEEDNTKGTNEKDEIKLSMVEDYRAGKTYNELAQKYHYSIYTIRKRVLEVATAEELKEIVDKRKSIKTDFFQDEIDNIIQAYESGLEKKTEIAKRYHTNLGVIDNLLLKEYKKRGLNYIPAIVSKTAFLERIHKKHYTKQQMIESATSAKKIIPPQLLEEYFEKDINIDKIRKYVINRYTMGKQNETLRNNMFKSFNIASTLKNNGLGSNYQATALLYLLPQIVGATMEEIKKVVDNNEEILNAVRILNIKMEEVEYINNLTTNNIALRVKIAEKIEEIKQLTIEQESIDLSQYSRYYQLAKNTELIKDYEETVVDNMRTMKIKNGEER